MSDRRRSPSPPGKRSLSNQLSSLGAKLNRALSREQNLDRDQLEGADIDRESFVSAATVVPYPERSVSRGREGFRSSGRGGIGNIHQPISPSSTQNEASASTSSLRGRDETVRGISERAFSTGRGGAGNIHPPPQNQNEPTVTGVRPSSDADTLVDVPRFSSGNNALRGTENPRSASQGSTKSPPRTMHSTGRGGAGNIRLGPALTTVGETTSTQSSTGTATDTGNDT